jgi:uncharacterized protein (DUF1778 family)
LAYNNFEVEIMTQISKEERLHLRVTGDHHALIERAAALEGLSLTGFATRHLVDAAVQIVEHHQVTILRQEQARAFIQLLEENEPPKGVERLKSHFGKIELPVRKTL